jgi:hypothetical protein
MPRNTMAHKNKYQEIRDANNTKSAHPTQVSVLQRLVHHPEGHTMQRSTHELVYVDPPDLTT